jgi:hypothetical protein
MKRMSFILTVLLSAAAPSSDSQAFSGFFAGKGDGNLLNKASQVVIVHADDKTVVTMVNGFKGPLTEFALVVPVPIVLRKDSVRVVDMSVIDHLDAYSAPRLSEQRDGNPCRPYPEEPLMMPSDAPSSAERGSGPESSDLAVTVKATYTVGEYDIEVLSAREASGLETWLRRKRYNIPKGAGDALAPYIRSGFNFFVAKVNLGEQAKTGFIHLRPLQFAYPDQSFMLPIRLGMVNADGPQDLIAYVIAKDFRVEASNYRNEWMPANQEIPTFIKNDFKNFYQEVFDAAAERGKNQVVLTEFAWQMSRCDHCGANPLSAEELQQLGVWWLGEKQKDGETQATFVTRLRARYDRDSFPEDLRLKATEDKTHFQGTYVIRQPYDGDAKCDAAGAYWKEVTARREREIKTVASLTRWDPEAIRHRMIPLPEASRTPIPKKARTSGPNDTWFSRMREMLQKDS